MIQRAIQEIRRFKNVLGFSREKGPDDAFSTESGAEETVPEDVGLSEGTLPTQCACPPILSRAAFAKNDKWARPGSRGIKIAP